MAQVRTLEQQLAAGVLQIVKEGLALMRAMSHGATVGTQSEIRIAPEEGSPGRQAQGLRGPNPQAAGLRVRRDRPALQSQALAVGDQALPRGVEADRHGGTKGQGCEVLVPFWLAARSQSCTPSRRPRP